VAAFEKRMLEEGVATKSEIQEKRRQVQQLVDEAVEFARSSPTAPPEDAMKFVYAE
jgi:TPP-dependent pyruvate/acetoin dehydrogenase alpha subunit